MKCIKKGCCDLMEGAFTDDASSYLRGRWVDGLYCHSEILLKKIQDVKDEELDWSKIDVNDVVGNTIYPKH